MDFSRSISVTMALQSLKDLADRLEENRTERIALLKERDRLIRDAFDKTVNVTKISAYAGMSRHGVYDAINRTAPAEDDGF